MKSLYKKRPKERPDPEAPYTLKEAAAALAVSYDKMRRMIRDNHIDAIMIGDRPMIAAETLRYVQRNGTAKVNANG